MTGATPKLPDDWVSSMGKRCEKETEVIAAGLPQHGL